MTTILETRQLSWPDEAACADSAAGLAVRLAGGTARGACDAVIELHGPLGAGKTTFARHLLRALGVEGAVKSPTYTLMEPYAADAAHGAFAVSHFDFYRFDDPNEWEDAGFRDVFAAPGLKLVEWPEKAEGLLPVPDLALVIEPLEPSAPAPLRHEAAAIGGDDPAEPSAPRRVRLEARTPVGVALLP